MVNVAGHVAGPSTIPVAKIPAAWQAAGMIIAKPFDQ
jgi:hypothetical protein